MLNINLKGGLGIAQAQIKREIIYRFDFLIWSIVIPSWIVMSYFLWQSIYSFSGQEVIRGMTFPIIISYYIASLSVGIIADAGFDDWFADKIRNGKLIKFLNYPMNLVQFMFFKWGTKRIINLVVFIPPLWILGYFLVKFNPFNANILLTATTVFMAVILNFSFVMLFALIAFWFKDIKGVKHLRQGITWFLAGSIIPLNFFPQWFQTMSYYLPFQYMRYVPARIMLGSTEFGYSIVLNQFIWVVIMIMIVAISWRKAMRQFSGVGV